ncbi:MAG: Cna B-type domain-containing protein, partial [Clostridia bacterium]|nr:Cna B-type domain-containing protein [Clostridia bacterium]
MTIRKLTIWLLCAACLLMGVASAAPGGSLSIDISSATGKGLERLEGVPFELYRVGVPDGTTDSAWGCAPGFESVTAITERAEGPNREWTAGQIDRICAQAQAVVNSGEVSPVVGQTDQNGRVAFTGLEDGIYYLIKPENASPRRLKVRPVLIAIPNLSSATPQDIAYDMSAVGKLTYEPVELIDIPVQKLWNDGNDFDGIRPSSLIVRLLRDGEKTDCEDKTISAENGWSAVWTNLPRSNEDGEDYVYTVTEDMPSGYTLTAPASAENGYILENNHEVEKGSLLIRKEIKLSSSGDADEATRTRIGNYLAGLTFTFHVSGPSDADYAAEEKTKVSDGESPNFVDRDIAITVNPQTLAGEYVFSGSLMPGHYTVTEVTDGLPEGMTLTAFPQ